MREVYLNVIEGYWAASIDSRYGGCNVPDLDYELIINHSQRSNSDTNWVASQWSAEGDIENILHTAISFTAHLDDVINGPNEWLERLYYLTLYLLPDELKPTFQQWFTSALEKLEKYTPKLSTTGEYEDIFDEHWAENRGLPVPPQLLDPEFNYQPEKNTELVKKFLDNLNHENNYINDPDDLIENGFQGKPFVYEGFIIKEKKSVDIKPLFNPNEDLSALSTIPSIIKAAAIERDTDFEYDSYLYTDDRDGYMTVSNPKLAHILAEMEGKAQIGLSLAASEWVIEILKDTSKPERLIKLIEAMWAQMDPNYIKPEKISPYQYDDNEDDDEDIEEEDLDINDDENEEVDSDAQEMIEGLYEILGGAHNYYKRGGVDYTDTLHAVLLARNLQKDKTIFDAWMHNVVARIMQEYPRTNTNKEEKEEESIIYNPAISRAYYFNPDTVYNESDEKDKLNRFISKLDYNINNFLPAPEKVYLISYVRGELNENPYNRNYSFPREITAYAISDLGDDFSWIENDEMAMVCFDIAEKSDPGDRSSYANRGVHYYRRKKYDLAIEYLLKTAAIEGKAGTYYYLGCSYYNLDDYEKAYEAFVTSIGMDKTILDEKEPGYLSGKFANLAYDAIQQGDNELTIELCNKALVLNPENETAYLNRSVAYLNMGNNKKANEDMEKLREINPEGAARSYINESVTLNRQGNYQEAIDKAAIALQLIKDNKEEECDAYQEIGYAYGEMKVFDKAFENMNKAIELSPDEPVRYINAGYYLRAIKRFEEAIEYYNKAIEIIPEDRTVLAYDNRGKAYAATEKFDKALQDWIVCYNYSHSFTEFIYTILGYASIGNIKKAKKLVKESFEKENDATNGDELVYFFIQYALQIDMDNALDECEELLEEGKTNVDYPLGKLVQVAVENGHPDAQKLAEIAKKINQTDSL